jgi:hypothetical protein
MDAISLRNRELIEDSSASQIEQIFVRSQTVVSRRIAGETLIVPVRGKVGDLASIYSFNGTGSLIWQSLESPKTLPELIAAVEQEYAVEHEQAARDVKQFLDEMFSADLVEVRPAVAMAPMGSAALESQVAASH